MSLVSTIISLAHNLGLGVIAEGVETDEQSRMLRLRRCNQAQSYFYGRSVPDHEIEKLLTNDHLPITVGG
ncbi:EAL domain-containing protein [Pseudohongiella sp.]|jgi:EAL domain-containing protein (putative c-di-GMP-specific phosphodiesterase class I)|uniref:EAL domain-containing protein n=1 Tax=marine sediment metagenome TaxID=412755 RepID=A0A0F9W5W5_9ZZZZ|nr:EAL domain-containing protein [Pseudohongiella sp.]HDZ09626.1 EAL domain-containing protein [Pseudohongiella sp.]HEA61816.1 EAL domain-containing protein [Pseudohongiella sp.]